MGFERDASLHPGSFIGEPTDEESLCSRTLRDTEVNDRAALPLLGVYLLHRLCYSVIFGTFIPALACRAFYGREKMQTQHKKTLRVQLAVNWFLKLGRS